MILYKHTRYKILCKCLKMKKKKMCETNIYYIRQSIKMPNDNKS